MIWPRTAAPASSQQCYIERPRTPPSSHLRSSGSTSAAQMAGVALRTGSGAMIAGCCTYRRDFLHGGEDGDRIGAEGIVAVGWMDFPCPDNRKRTGEVAEENSRTGRFDRRRLETRRRVRRHPLAAESSLRALAVRTRNLLWVRVGYDVPQPLTAMVVRYPIAQEIQPEAPVRHSTGPGRGMDFP